MLKKLYLLLTILGALIPWWFLCQYFVAHGFDVAQLISTLFANGAVAGFALDLVISSLVFWLFMFVQARQGGPKPYLFILLNLVFGLSCALPAYLYARG